MKMHLLGALALTGAALALPVTANAATFTSLLEYRGGGLGPLAPPFGVVTLDEIDANTVKVTVALTDPGSRIINTGGGHDPFVFNTTSDENVTIVSGGTVNPGLSFFDGGHGSFMISGFGQPTVPFTDEIGLGVFVPDVPAVPCTPKGKKCVGGSPDVPAHWEDGPNGFPGGKNGPLVFTVANAGGMTFAGVGFSSDSSGKVTGLGSGEHFLSTSLGWWFAADIYDGVTGTTYSVGAKDACISVDSVCATSGGGTVPEPASWALMLVGFGGVGALLRCNRRVARAALA
jgi:hypothetical protein